MKVYTTEDHTGATSIHLAHDDSAAVQAHLIHYSRTHLSEAPKVKCVRDLMNVKRNHICWDIFCVLAGASGENIN